MDIFVLILFAAVLVGCIVFDTSILIALVVGYFLFALATLKKGFTLKNVLLMSLEGVLAAKNILITFMLIGMLTALWRASGTIPSIVCHSMKIVRSDIIIPITFLLNCMVSFLTGTAFGTSATMGCICMTVAKAMGADPVLVGGAIVSGAFFGDRCSPVSTSALLVSELTGTDLYKNIKNMMKSAAVPFMVTLAVYAISGIVFSSGNNGSIPDVDGMFSNVFSLDITTLIPAVLILVLSLAKLNVKITMSASIIASVIICTFVQKQTPGQIVSFAIFGYETTDTSIAAMINGGGIISMLRVAAIVSISSCYSGIFRKTGILDSVGKAVSRIGERTYPFAAVVITSVAASMIACNQTLAIMLTDQLTSSLEKNKERFAVFLENSAVVIAPLIPWSIAGGVPIASSGSPQISLLTAFYLYLIPLYGLMIYRKQKDKKGI